MTRQGNSGRSPGTTALLGALELKRCYYRNLLSAVFIVVGTAFAIILPGLLFSARAEPPVERGPWAREFDSTGIASLLPPPPVEIPPEDRPPAPPPMEDMNVFTGDIEVISDTEYVETEPVFQSQDEISSAIGDGAGDGVSGAASGVSTGGTGNRPPEPATFVAVEQRPVLVERVQPQYPSIAKRAGIEGDVWLQVFVDVDGSVIDAVVAKESGANAGFEEAALEAAYKCKWTPGMQNDQPVRVWVAYEVRFRLR